MYKSVGMPEFYQEAKRQNLPIIDVRERDEYAAGHVPNAKNLPLSTLEENVDTLDKEQAYYLICQAGGRSARAAEFLSAQGFDVTNVMGGTSAWPGEMV
ncbi:rhodanese-like domain-containing protein [Enterococcus sp. LJL98]